MYINVFQEDAQPPCVLPSKSNLPNWLTVEGLTFSNVTATVAKGQAAGCFRCTPEKPCTAAFDNVSVKEEGSGKVAPGFVCLNTFGTTAGGSQPAACKPQSNETTLPPGTWSIIAALSDEFDEQSLNQSKWTACPDDGGSGACGWKGREPGLFSSANVDVNGDLQLWARGAHRNASWPPGFDNFTTAYVTSHESLPPGTYAEARTRSGSSCISSSFWMHANDGNGTWTEIDVYESMGSSGCAPPTANISTRLLCSHTHIFNLSGVPKSEVPSRCGCENAGQDGAEVCSSGGCVEVPFDFDASFHTFGLLWGAENISIFADGVQAHILNGTCFTQPLFIQFDRETMPDWMGVPMQPFSTDVPFAVDYIRAYTKVSM